MPTSGSSNNIPGRPSYAHAAWLGAVGPRIAAGYGAMPLPIVVEAVLAELTSADQSFTAYDVTMILRALFPYPQRELPHYDQHGAPGVQPEVHRQMADYLAAAAYRSTSPTPTAWTQPASTRPTSAVGAPAAGSASPPCSGPAMGRRPCPSARG